MGQPLMGNLNRAVGKWILRFTGSEKFRFPENSRGNEREPLSDSAPFKATFASASGFKAAGGDDSASAQSGSFNYSRGFRRSH